VSGEPLALAVLGAGVVDVSRPWLHADDAGVLRGRAAFETMRVYGGRPFRLDSHLERLVGSADVLDLPAPDPAALAPLAGEAVAAAAAAECVLRVVWTGGREHDEPGFGFALVTALPDGLEQQRLRGLSLASLQLAIGAHARRSSPWLLPGVKSTSYAVNMAAQNEARRRGADDALFLSAEGIVLEGPTSNVWLREDDLLVTPPLDLGILAGVTRDTLLAAAGDAGLGVQEQEFGLDRLAAADEVFSSSSVREVMPVVALDGRPLAGGQPGEAAAAMQAALRAVAQAG
jgi:4-amino-4-deoxychorismate lyase